MILRSIQLAFIGCLSLLPTGAAGSASSAFLQAWRYKCSISQAASVCTGRYSEQGRLSEVWKDPPVSGSKADADAYRKAAK